MPLIDDQGRLFGKLNIVDVSVGLVVGLLIPLMYGAYLLFRPPLPRLVAVDPPQVEQGATQVQVRGEYLSPAFRLMVDDVGARFLLADTRSGVLELPPLQPGSYDVLLLDQYQELSRLPGALTVVAPAQVNAELVASGSFSAADSTTVVAPAQVNAELVASGSFSAADSTEAESLWATLQAAGQDATRSWDVLDVQPPEPGFRYWPPPQGGPSDGGPYQVRAVIRFRCNVVKGTECSAFDVPLSRGAVVPVPARPDGEADAPFRVIDLHPVYTSVLDVALRATGCSQGAYLTPEELSVLRAVVRDDDTRSLVAKALTSSIESVDVQGETSDRGVIVVAHLRVPAVSTEDGWMHGMGNYRDSAGMIRGSLLKVGAYFIVNDRSLQLCGRIVDVGPATPLN